MSVRTNEERKRGVSPVVPTTSLLPLPLVAAFPSFPQAPGHLTIHTSILTSLVLNLLLPAFCCSLFLFGVSALVLPASVCSIVSAACICLLAYCRCLLLSACSFLPPTSALACLLPASASSSLISVACGCLPPHSRCQLLLFHVCCLRLYAPSFSLRAWAPENPTACSRHLEATKHLQSGLITRCTPVKCPPTLRYS